MSVLLSGMTNSIVATMSLLHNIHPCSVQGIPKLDDANDAGSRNSHDCTLILTEGDSAKTLAIKGLGVLGRDHYGVFPLRGKLLNVREASHNQVRPYKCAGELTCL